MKDGVFRLRPRTAREELAYWHGFVAGVQLMETGPGVARSIALYSAQESIRRLSEELAAASAADRNESGEG